VHVVTALKPSEQTAASLLPTDATSWTLEDDSPGALRALVRSRALQAGDGLFVAGYGGAAAAVRDVLVELAYDRPLVGLAVGQWDRAWSDDQIAACDLFLAGSTVDRVQLGRRYFDPSRVIELAGLVAPDLITAVPDRAALLKLGVQRRELAVAVVMTGQGELAALADDVPALAALIPDMRLILIGATAPRVPAGWPAIGVARDALSLSALAACDMAVVAGGGAAGVAAATEARSLGLATLGPGATASELRSLVIDAAQRGELQRAAIEETETCWWRRGAEACESLLQPAASV